MKIIKRQIYYSGLTTYKKNPVIGNNTTFPVGNTIAKIIPTVPLNPPVSIKPIDFEIPIFLEQSFEDIGIYTDFLHSYVYDGEMIMGNELTTNQINYIISKRPEVINYTQGIQFWWDEIGKFEINDNKIRIEELISVESKILSTSKQLVSPPSSLNVKSLTFYNGNEIELDFRVYLKNTYKYIIKLNNYSATYIPQNWTNPSDLVTDISNFISTEPIFAPLELSTQYIQNNRTQFDGLNLLQTTDISIKISAKNEILNLTSDVVSIINNDDSVLTYSQITGLTSTTFDNNIYKTFYVDQPKIPNASVNKQTLQPSPYTIYSSMTTGESGQSLDKFYIPNFLGHEYSAITANWEVDKNGYSNFFSDKHTITGVTTQRFNEISTYDNTNPIQKGVNGVTQITNEFTAYTINDINYITYNSDDLFTTYSLISNGFNSDNITLDNIIKEEYLDGVVFPPTVISNIDIERQNDTILLPVFRVNQIKNVEEFSTYDNGFYVVDNQTIGIKHIPK